MAKRLRIISGLILFAFVAMHLTNIAFGLSSIKAIEDASFYLLAPWSNPVGRIVLGVAMLVHMALGLSAIYRRNTFNMSRNDLVQVLSSLALVPLLIPHLIGTVVVDRVFDLPQNFAGTLLLFWFGQPLEGLRQILLLAVVWIHGCIGLFIWLKLQPWWRHIWFICYPLAVLLPVLAMLGYVEGGNAVMSGEVEVVYAQPPAEGPTIDEILATLNQWKWIGIWLFVAAATAVLGARAWRVMARRGNTRISYSGYPSFPGGNGLTLLEAAGTNDIPHAALCGGRARCGTCRVRVLSSSEPLPPPSEHERHTLERLDAEPDVRLACQLRIHGGQLEVERLVSPSRSLEDLRSRQGETGHGPFPPPEPEAAA